MSNIVRIDKETYTIAAKNIQQLELLGVIFKTFDDKIPNADVYFEYDIDNSTYLSYFYLKKEKKVIEIPFLKKKDRKFYIDNMIIVEKWLNYGENLIYILSSIIIFFKDKITLTKIIENLKLFEFGDKK